MIRALPLPVTAALRILAGLALTMAALAQPPAPAPGEARWVQYELIAFRPVDPLPSDEQWPRAELPEYPAQIAFLLEPGSAAYEAALREREFELSLQAEEGSAEATADPLPRVRLAGADTLLAAAADRIGNSREYRLLGHFAWRQPLPDTGQAEHLLITGGTASGEHFELEGYITLSRSRFLHVETTLWLNELLPPGTEPPAQSVELPALPRPQLPEPEPAPAAPGTTPPLEPNGPDAAAGGALEGLAADTGAQPIAVEPQHALSSVLLRASRRLAGNGIHYIDHPRLGLILSARPWDPAVPVPGPEASTTTGAVAAPIPAAP